MSNQPEFKGIDKSHTVAQKKLLRDTRPLWLQTVSMFNSREMIAGIMTSSVAIMLFFPSEFSFLAFFSGLLVYWLRKRATAKDHLPFRMPATSGLTDYGSPKPGRSGFFKGEGVFMLGNAFGKNRTELWMGVRDMLTHMLVFGTTGSGKTEFLVSMAFNSLAMGSGMFYVDPKAAPKLQAQIYVMCRLCGRDDDYRTLNYLTTEKAAGSSKTPIRTTNTTNPFAYGNAESLANMLISLIPSAEGSNAIFNQNAQNLMRSLMYALVEMRDRGEIQLSVETIREYMVLQKCMDLAERSDFTQNTRASLQAFLSSVGWQEGKTIDKQPRSLPEQFGYARSYFGQPLNSLTDTYSHIYRTPMGEVDMRDVFLNRRILVVLLPALAVAPEELKSLGKVSLSAIRIAISAGLGDGKEGAFADTLYSLPTDAPAPFLSVTDEYAAIPTPGYVEVLTQGRGLGVAAIVASQDYAGITKADQAGAQQLLENTKLKIALKLTSASDTWELFQKLAGEANVMQTQSFQIRPDVGLISTDYRDQLSAAAQKVQRVTLADLQNQVEGEFHAFFGDEMVRGASFFANPPLPANMQLRINQMVRVWPPDPKAVEMKYGRTRAIIDLLIERGDRLLAAAGESIETAEAAALDESFDQLPRSLAMIQSVFQNSTLSNMETAIAALVQYHQALEDEDASDYLVEERNETDPYSEDDEFDMLPGDGDDDVLFEEKSGANAMQDLSRKYRNIKTREVIRDMAEAGELSGLPKQRALEDARQIAKAIQESTRLNYPVPPTPAPNSPKKDVLGQALNDFLSQARSKKENDGDNQ